MRKINTRRTALLSILVLNIVIMTLGWWKISASQTHGVALWYIAFGRLTGLLASLTILIEIVTMSRAPLIENTFNMEELTWFHKINGYIMVGSLVGHIFFLLAGYAILDKLSWLHEFGLFNSGFSDVLNASLGSLVLVIAVAASVKVARNKLPYQWWYAAHLTLYLAILLTFPHIVNSGGDFVGHPLFTVYIWAVYGITLGTLGIYRFLRPFYYLWKYDFRVESIINEANKIHSIHISGRNIDEFKFKPGQFAVWWFLQPGLWWEGHPFSFSAEADGKQLRLTFKESGNFTTKLAANLKVGSRVLIDGPRGMFTSEQTKTADVLMIAGGIGVTPLRTMATRLVKEGKKVTLLYSTKDQANIAFRNEFGSIKNPNFTIEYYAENVNGRLQDQTIAAHLQPHPAAKTVYLCGPPAMMDVLHPSLVKLGVPKQNILSERFSF